MSWPNDVRRPDLRVDTLRGSGKGGQNRNKRDTAVRITHLPTGLVGYAEDQRTQGQNKKLAFQRLAVQLVPIMKREATKERFRASSEVVRTYHEPDNRVTDARLSGQWPFADIVYKDGLGDIIDELVRERAR